MAPPENMTPPKNVTPPKANDGERSEQKRACPLVVILRGQFTRFFKKIE